MSGIKARWRLLVGRGARCWLFRGNGGLWLGLGLWRGFFGLRLGLLGLDLGLDLFLRGLVLIVRAQGVVHGLLDGRRAVCRIGRVVLGDRVGHGVRQIGLILQGVGLRGFRGGGQCVGHGFSF